MAKAAKTFKDLVVWQRAHQVWDTLPQTDMEALLEEVSKLLVAYGAQSGPTGEHSNS